MDDLAYQRGLHDLFSGLFDKLIDAIEYGLNRYRMQAGLVEVVINGAIATGGGMDGPALDGLIAGFFDALSPMLQAGADFAARAVAALDACLAL